MKPQFKPEEIYIDLSKLSEEQIKSLPRILENAGECIGFHTSIRLNSGKLKDDFVLYFNSFFKKWFLWNHIFKNNTKTELTYPEFIKLFEGGEGKEVLQVENYTREDMEKAYRAGEKGATYYFKDTTVILPTTYEGVDG